jgi:hypothetical protein
VQDIVEVPDPPVMLCGENEQVNPAEETGSDKETLPVNPESGEIVIVEVPVWPVTKVTEDGFAEIVKS